MTASGSAVARIVARPSRLACVTGYALKLGAVAFGLLLAGVLAVLLFNGVWFQIGFGAAFALLAGILILIAWRVDKKGKQEREGLERI